MIQEILLKNGLSEKEAKVYLAALECGEATVAQIALKAKIERPTAYNILEKMRERELLSVAKRKGVQYFSVLPPRMLVERFQRAAQSAQEILPNLLEIAYASPLKPRIQFYEGMEGLKDLWRQVSFSEGLAVGFTDYDRMPSEFFTFIREELLPRRKRIGSIIHLITPQSKNNLKVQSQDPPGPNPYIEHRVIDFPAHEPHIEILMFEHSKIACISFIPGEMFGILIDSHAIHSTLKSLFSVLWSKADKRPI